VSYPCTVSNTTAGLRSLRKKLIKRELAGQAKTSEMKAVSRFAASLLVNTALAVEIGPENRNPAPLCRFRDRCLVVEHFPCS
jgi:hypothetical protein